ncbi:glycosyltransferase family 2 protein [Lutibacter sp.]|uniref:glycosyltransferase family 2 protein n=1 Tax=Lutibacter sp. TaxID=1925666 RepID=UPI001A2C6D83|nr:glycosyltransferase family 2 protein [Lutibacter sp.]MBI9041553.1 glycosyltransferase family 2 protein [Lutibacter sp.]
MKNNIKISVIIPVYNTGKYLRKCLNSVINQTIKEIEIIVVNDGSTDNSLSICEEFSKKDKRIFIIDKANEGLEMARKTGLKKALGEYVTHLDSDDWLKKNALEILYNAATKSNAEIVSGNSMRVMDKFGLLKLKNRSGFMLSDNLIIQEDFIKYYYKNFFGINIFPVSMWGRLYKKSFIDNIDVIPIRCLKLGEDLNYNIQVFPEAKNIYFTKEVVYNYRFGGMTSKFNSEIIEEALKMYVLKQEMILKYKLPELDKYIKIELKNYLRTYIEMLLIYKPFSKEQSYGEIEKLMEHNNYKEIIAFYKKNGINGDDFAEALIQKNVKRMFEIIQIKVTKERYVRKLKMFISKVLN